MQEQHRRTDNSLARPKCSCGWRQEISLRTASDSGTRRKSDEELIRESEDAFEMHACYCEG